MLALAISGTEVLYGKPWPFTSRDLSQDMAVTYAAERLAWQRLRISRLAEMVPIKKVAFARQMCRERISKLEGIHDLALKALYRRTA